ncbi:hypothetical protein [Thermococcus eurythermalis]|uniref:hypothetical protein n=1 Tax=Thermococcus eurythermalis TaxID=1505907 RepID=UPI000679C76B|nr:hypothetical protein [Thermococcus eurythermalis]
MALRWEDVKIEYKFSFAVYLWGIITGIISGVLASYNRSAWILGFLLYFLVDKFVMAVIKELPPDVPEERAILKKAFWGWLLFWLYFTMLSYSVATDFQPVCYSNQSLLYQVVQNGTARIKCVFNVVG